ncbi:MAG: hypothetical protein PHI98_01375 [Eubacteriales bacterium]|nr:hypothetical protein [Eubacteriales bacterium]
MKIRSNEELLMFERTINACRAPVWLVTTDGQRYNLKNPMERYLGIGKLIRGHAIDDLEIYTSNREDEMCFFGYITDCTNHLYAKTA